MFMYINKKWQKEIKEYNIREHKYLKNVYIYIYNTYILNFIDVLIY